MTYPTTFETTLSDVKLGLSSARLRDKLVPNRSQGKLSAMRLDLKLPKIFYGWWVVGACFIIAVYVAGAIHFGFTAIFEPIADEFGWSYTQISIAASLRGLEMGLLAPFMGLLVDRWGPRRLIFGGAISIGLGLILLSQVTSLGMFYGAFFLIGLGVSTCSGTVLLTAVVNWFRRKMALATGIMTSGFACGGLLVPLVAALIGIFGWRTTMVILGLGTWGLALPLSLLVRHKPEQYGFLPDGEASNSTFVDESPSSVQGTGVEIQTKRAAMSGTFWHLALSLLLGQTLAISAVVTHVMPYLGNIGITRSASSLVASAIPVTSILGRLGFGWLGDRFNKKQLMAIGFALLSLGLVSFAYAAGKTWLLVPFLLLFGTGWGATVIMRVILLREYFGVRRFGTMHGFVMGVMTIGMIAGAPLAGWAFDKWGSYQGIWLVFAGLCVLAVFVVLTTPPFYKTTQQPDRPTA